MNTFNYSRCFLLAISGILLLLFWNGWRGSAAVPVSSSPLIRLTPEEKKSVAAFHYDASEYAFIRDMSASSHTTLNDAQWQCLREIASGSSTLKLQAFEVLSNSHEAQTSKRDDLLALANSKVQSTDYVDRIGALLALYKMKAPNWQQQFVAHKNDPDDSVRQIVNGILKQASS